MKARTIMAMAIVHAGLCAAFYYAGMILPALAFGSVAGIEAIVAANPNRE